MEKNKTGKYLKYAIGEIVLVMIGILLALQVNNWNQGRQNKELSKLYIEDFITEVSTDVLTLNNRIESNKKRIQNVTLIITTLATKKELSKNEIILFYEQNYTLGYESYFLPESSTFRQLDANNNGSLILDKKLRDTLYQYYILNDRNEKNGEISTQLYQHNFITKGLWNNLITGDMLEIEIGTSLNRSRFDLETLRQNSEYMMAIFLKKSMTESQNEQYQKIKVKAENLLELLESY